MTDGTHVDAFVAVEFMHGHGWRAMGHLGIGHDDRGRVLFGEVSPKGTSPAFTHMCYWVDNPAGGIDLHGLREKGLTLDVGGRVRVEPAHLNPALDSLAQGDSPSAAVLRRALGHDAAPYEFEGNRIQFAGAPPVTLVDEADGAVADHREPDKLEREMIRLNEYDRALSAARRSWNPHSDRMRPRIAAVGELLDQTLMKTEGLLGGLPDDAEPEERERFAEGVTALADELGDGMRRLGVKVPKGSARDSEVRSTAEADGVVDREGDRGAIEPELGD